MRLAEKIRYLREVEGSLRGLDRPMTQSELVQAVRKEQGKSISQSYISQIEGGSRRHMTQASRSLLAKFFKVHQRSPKGGGCNYTGPFSPSCFRRYRRANFGRWR